MANLMPIGTGDKKYLHIVGGNLAQSVSKDTEGARMREWEKDGNRGVKYELLYSNVSGRITDVVVKEGKFNEVCDVVIDDKTIISLNTNSRYFSDFAQKVMGADMTKEITLHPYAMDDGEKVKTGISVQQDGEKLPNHFRDYDKKVNLHGMPEVDEEKKEKLGKDYWKGYFIEVKVFLIEQLRTLDIPKPVTAEDVEKVMAEPEYTGAGSDRAKAEIAAAVDDSGDVDLPF